MPAIRHNAHGDTPATIACQRINSALLAARLAHQRRAQSVDQYRAAIRQATRAGCTYTEIAAVLGITRQAVRQYHLTNH